MSENSLLALAGQRQGGRPRGITSVCSAHSLVIEAALRQSDEDGTDALIEATCNQVNQDGGYTGMTPIDFRNFVYGIANQIGFPHARIMLGGDHLGPNPWKHLPADKAMARAEVMVAAFAAAGYEKLHLDTSMGCHGDAGAPPETVIAARAARLAIAAEKVASGNSVYVIGTEVPTPGGAAEDTNHLTPTQPGAVRTTHDVHKKAFHEAGAGDAWQRVIALVVQPGAEFGHGHVIVYQPERARALCATLNDWPNFVFEAHSTDYQPATSLRALVQDGFAILKVGPGLTFALREAIYGLDAIARAIAPNRQSIADVMEAIMLERPADWKSHYPGSPDEQRVLRHFSYSDRIRYYWPHEKAGRAVEDLLRFLDSVTIPDTLVSQYLPRLYERVTAGILPSRAHPLLIESVRDVLRIYAEACADTYSTTNF